MEHSQVTTFFHEFGHLMHSILGGQNQQWALFSGVATERDFVEAPSQMLEEWAFDASTLQTFARHRTTNTPIPASLVSRLQRADTFPRNCWAQQQMFYAMLSLQLHHNMSLAIEQQFSTFPHVPNTHFEANFGHLMGYSAVYYTYMWSQAIARHMYQRFEAAAASDGLGVGELDVWVQYRDLVLGMGGKRPAASLVYDFVGSSVTLDPLRAWLAGE